MPLILATRIFDPHSMFGSRLPRWMERLKNWRPFWKQVFIPRYIEMIQQNFETEGELVGGWPDLKPEYAAWKARHFPGTKILERTRRLRQSLAHGATGPDTVLEVRPLELRIGTRVPHARWVRFMNREFLPPVLKKDFAQLARDFWVERLRRLEEDD